MKIKDNKIFDLKVVGKVEKRSECISRLKGKKDRSKTQEWGDVRDRDPEYRFRRHQRLSQDKGKVKEFRCS